MRFLADQDVYAVTINFLRSLGHEVVTASQLSMARAKDLELLSPHTIKKKFSSPATATLELWFSFRLPGRA